MAPKLFAGVSLLSIAIVLSCIGTALAQEPPASPRTPMAPGSSTFAPTMLPRGDGSPWGIPVGMAPPHLEPMVPRATSSIPPPDLGGLDTAAITLVAAGTADVVISSHANTELILQLYRPDQNQWQEYRLAPLTNTPIVCSSCGGRLKFSFNNGTRESEINVEAPAMLRIYPDATNKLWQWDVFNLQTASRSP